MQQAKPSDTGLAEIASNFVNNLLSQVPSITDWKHTLLLIFLTMGIVLFMLVCFPCFLKLLIKDVKLAHTKLHELKLIIHSHINTHV